MFVITPSHRVTVGVHCQMALPCHCRSPEAVGQPDHGAAVWLSGVSEELPPWSHWWAAPLPVQPQHHAGAPYTTANLLQSLSQLLITHISSPTRVVHCTRSLLHFHCVQILVLVTLYITCRSVGCAPVSGSTVAPPGPWPGSTPMCTVVATCLARRLHSSSIFTHIYTSLWFLR